MFNFLDNFPIIGRATKKNETEAKNDKKARAKAKRDSRIDGLHV